MQIVTKFDLNKHVWNIARSSVYQPVPCVTCGETGRVMIGAEEFVCPRCQGKKMDRRTVYRWHVDRSGTIERIMVEAFAGEQHCSERYMFDKRGGSVYRAEDLFGTRSEAEAECAVRNEADA